MLGRSTNVAALQADADVAAWVAAVIAAGGSVSATQQAYVTTLIQALKGCGAWALTDDYALYAVESQTQAMVTLKKRITQTLVHKTSADPTFVANRGFHGNKDGVVDTGWSPSSGVNFQQNSARYGAWMYSPPSVQSYLIGGDDSLYLQLTVGNATNTFYVINTPPSGSPDSYAHGGSQLGWHDVERTATNVESAYLNGVLKGTGSQTSTARTSLTFYIFGDNTGASMGGLGDSGCSAACWGAPLTDAAMYAAQYGALRAYMTSVGVP